MRYEYIPTDQFLIKEKSLQLPELRFPPLGRHDYLVVSRTLSPSSDPTNPLRAYFDIPILKGLVHIDNQPFEDEIQLNAETTLQRAEEALRGSVISYINAAQKLVNAGIDPLFLITEDAILNPGTTTVIMRMAGATTSQYDGAVHKSLEKKIKATTRYFENEQPYGQFMVLPEKEGTIAKETLLKPRFSGTQPIAAPFYIPVDQSTPQSIIVNEVVEFTKGRNDNESKPDAWYQKHIFPLGKPREVQRALCIFPHQ